MLSHQDFNNKSFLFAIIFVVPFIIYYPNPFEETQESIFIFGKDLTLNLWDLRSTQKLVSFRNISTIKLSMNCSFLQELIKYLSVNNFFVLSDAWIENDLSNDSEECSLYVQRVFLSLVNTNARYLMEVEKNNLSCKIFINYSSIKDGCFHVYLCNFSFLNMCNENDLVLESFINYLEELVSNYSEFNNTTAVNDLRMNFSISLDENESIFLHNFSNSASENILLNSSLWSEKKEENHSNTDISLTNIQTLKESKEIKELEVKNVEDYNLTLRNLTSQLAKFQIFEVDMDKFFYEDEYITYTIVNKGCKSFFEKKVYGIDYLQRNIMKVFSNSSIANTRTFRFTLSPGKYVLNIKCEDSEINKTFEVLFKDNSCEELFKKISFLKTQISFLQESDCFFRLHCFYPHIFEKELNLREKKSFKYSELNCSFFKLSYENLFYYYAVEDFINELLLVSFDEGKEREKENKYYVFFKKLNRSEVLEYLKIVTDLSMEKEISFLNLTHRHNQRIVEVEIVPRLLGCEVGIKIEPLVEERKEESKRRTINKKEFLNQKDVLFVFSLKDFENRNFSIYNISYLDNMIARVILYRDKKERILLSRLEKNFTSKEELSLTFILKDEILKKKENVVYEKDQSEIILDEFHSMFESFSQRIEPMNSQKSDVYYTEEESKLFINSINSIDPSYSSKNDQNRTLYSDEPLPSSQNSFLSRLSASLGEFFKRILRNINGFIVKLFNTKDEIRHSNNKT